MSELLISPSTRSELGKKLRALMETLHPEEWEQFRAVNSLISALDTLQDTEQTERWRELAENVRDEITTTMGRKSPAFRDLWNEMTDALRPPSE